jgi:hypothetical protein
MTDISTLLESPGKEYLDPKLRKRDFRDANEAFPSYSRSLRIFSESLTEANQVGRNSSFGPVAIDFLSTTAHVAIV